MIPRYTTDEYAHAWQIIIKFRLENPTMPDNESRPMALGDSIHHYKLSGGRILSVKPQLFNTVLLLSPSLESECWSNEWTYERTEEAICAAERWIALNDAEPEPQGWIRHSPTYRRRENGDDEKEYCRDGIFSRGDTIYVFVLVNRLNYVETHPEAHETAFFGASEEEARHLFELWKKTLDFSAEKLTKFAPEMREYKFDSVKVPHTPLPPL